MKRFALATALCAIGWLLVPVTATAQRGRGGAPPTPPTQGAPRDVNRDWVSVFIEDW